MKLRTLFKAALLLTALAAVALALDWRRRYGEGPGLIGRPLLPADFPLRAADLLLIETASGNVTLRRDRDDWVVAELGGFPANRRRIRQRLLDLAQARIGQDIGADPDALPRLGLLQKHENANTFEASRTASVFTIVETKTGRDKALFQVLIGNRRDGGGTYVRIPGSNRVYLVDIDLSLNGDPASWMRRRILPASAAESVLEIRVRPPRGPPFRLWRGSMGTPWRLDDTEQPPDQEAVQALARAVTGLNVVTADKEQGTPAPKEVPATVEARLATGWRLSVTMLPETATPEQGRDVLLSARATGATGHAAGPEPDEAPEVAPAQRVAAFNRHYAGRRVTIEPATARVLLRGRDAYASAR